MGVGVGFFWEEGDGGGIVELWSYDGGGGGGGCGVVMEGFLGLGWGGVGVGW